MGQAISVCGHNVNLFCTSDKARLYVKTYKIDNVNIVEFPDLLWGKLRQGLDIWNTVNRLIFVLKKNYDIVHGIDCRPVVIFPALFLKIIKKTKFVLSWWDIFGNRGTSLERSGLLYYTTFGKIEVFFEEYFRKFADYSIVISQYLKNKLLSLNFPDSKIEILRIGCNSSNCTGYNKSFIRKTFNLPTDEFLLCFVGSLFEKDKKLLMDALRLLKKRIVKLPMTIILGRIQFESDICSKLNIEQRGIVESAEDLRKILFVCDYGLVPMKRSNANRARWPSKTTDYWSIGLPVIATPISDYEDLFHRFNLGFLSKSDSPEDYANAIYDAINSSEELRKVKRDSIQNYVETELNWSILAQRLCNIYQKLL